MCNAGNAGLIRGSKRVPREGNGNLLHYFYLKNPVDGEPGRLWSMELQRVGHHISDRAHIQEMNISLEEEQRILIVAF